MTLPTVAVVGASNDRNKYGNKAVRAYVRRGWIVWPVHPREPAIEGLPAWPDVRSLPGRPDRVLLYVPAAAGMAVLDDVAARGCRELWVNPGAESPELLEKAERLGLEPVQACGILAVGESPEE